MDRFTHRAVPYSEFRRIQIPEPDSILGELVSAGSIGMLAGPRGVGKSMLAMTQAYCAAGAINLSPWGRGGGVVVCYLDGEMRASGLQRRLKLLENRFTDAKGEAAATNLHILSRDLVQDLVGELDTDKGQAAIDERIPSDVRLIVVDNIASWTRGGREDADSWAPIKSWLLKKRLSKVAVLLIHHAGKNGLQRGTSAHEDLLDYSILLEPLRDDLSFEGARFLVRHTKLRDHLPSLATPYEVRISEKKDKLNYRWFDYNPLLQGVSGEIIRLAKTGKRQVHIAHAVKVSKATVSRVLQKAKEQSLLDYVARPGMT